MQTHLCALNEKIEDVKCKLTGKNCGENMDFVTVKRNVIPISSLSKNYQLEICIQQCKCVENNYIEKDGKCFMNSTIVSSLNKAVSCFIRCSLILR